MIKLDGVTLFDNEFSGPIVELVNNATSLEMEKG